MYKEQTEAQGFQECLILHKGAQSLLLKEIICWAVITE